MLPSAFDTEKSFDEILSKNSNFDDSVISLPVFSSRTNLKLHNIFVTPKMVKKVKTILDPVVVSKNRELELSYMLPELSNMCLKEFCFPNCCKFFSMVPVFKKVGVSSAAQTYCPVSLTSGVSKVFERLVHYRIVNI